jgi:hypothetical protein
MHPAARPPEWPDEHLGGIAESSHATSPDRRLALRYARMGRGGPRWANNPPRWREPVLTASRRRGTLAAPREANGHVGRAQCNASSSRAESPVPGPRGRHFEAQADRARQDVLPSAHSNCVGCVAAHPARTCCLQQARQRPLPPPHAPSEPRRCRARRGHGYETVASVPVRSIRLICLDQSGPSGADRVSAEIDRERAIYQPRHIVKLPRDQGQRCHPRRRESRKWQHG